MPRRPSYKNLYFGKSDSKNEVNDRREEFIKSYVDLDGALSLVLSGEKFLVLGPKGTGKSALAWYLQASEDESDHVVLVRDASALPLAEVPRMLTGQPAGPERTVVAWKFILLCTYLELLLRDQGSSTNQDPEALRVADLLRDFGFMGDASGRALTTASKTTVKIPLPHLGDLYKRESKREINIYNLIPYLEAWAWEAESRCRHVLLLDGLDSILLNDPKYDESLASLVQAAYQLNQLLSQHDACGSIVLLLRNDVFNRIALSLPDSQKMRDDLSFDLDWRIMSGPAGVKSPLMKLVDTKAAKAAGRQRLDVLGYFPESIEVGSRGRVVKPIPTFQYLLNMTRHTPRDLLRIFEEIRRVEASGEFEPSGDTLRQDVIREGVLQYSTKYFIGAIRNEFAGTEGGPESAEAALSALKSLNRQRFTRDEFIAALKEVFPDANALQPNRLLTLLFYAGAIGNATGIGAKSYMHFYHRRDESEIYLHGTFILHEALIHAWGLRRHAASDGGPARRRVTRAGVARS